MAAAYSDSQVWLGPVFCHLAAGILSAFNDILSLPAETQQSQWAAEKKVQHVSLPCLIHYHTAMPQVLLLILHPEQVLHFQWDGVLRLECASAGHVVLH